RMICSASANSRLSGVFRTPAMIFPVAGSRISPKAFTATRLDTMTPRGSVTLKKTTPAFIAFRLPQALPTPAPGPAPTTTSAPARTFGHRIGACRCGRRFAHCQIRTRHRLADTEVVENRGRNDRHGTSRGPHAFTATLQKAPYAGGGLQSKSAAAGENDRMRH